RIEFKHTSSPASLRERGTRTGSNSDGANPFNPAQPVNGRTPFSPSPTANLADVERSASAKVRWTVSLNGHFTNSPSKNRSTCAGCIQRHARLHFLLASRRHRAERYGLVRLLCRRHFRTLHRQNRPVVHSGNHADCGNGGLALYRELRDV